MYAAEIVETGSVASVFADPSGTHTHLAYCEPYRTSTR